MSSAPPGRAAGGVGVNENRHNGSGIVAQTFGAGFLKHGHEVTLGTRDAAKLQEWATKNSGARVGSFAEAAKFGEVVVLAVAGTAAQEALQLAGTNHLAGGREFESPHSDQDNTSNISALRLIGGMSGPWLG